MPSVLAALSNTAIVAMASVAVASVLAVVLALYTEWEGAIGRRLLELSSICRSCCRPSSPASALLVSSAELGIDRGIVTIMVGHTVFVLAVAYRLVLTRLQALPRSLVEASFDLGASRWQTLRYVLLPHLASAVMTGAVLALTLVLRRDADHHLRRRRPDDLAVAALGDDARRLHARDQCAGDAGAAGSIACHVVPPGG